MPPEVNFDVPLQPKQRELMRIADSIGPTIIGVGGSRGSSKSHGGRSCMLLRRLAYPGTAGAILRRKMKQIRSNHLENGYFKQWPIMREWWQESKRTIYLPNGSRIVMLVAEHPSDIDDHQGDEFMDLMIDEAARFSQNELNKINVARRWTGQFGGKAIPDGLCKTWWLMNPGGPGHNHIRRVMFLREYQEKERGSDYHFIQSYAWDNVEWSRGVLAARGLDPHDYYSWTDKKRFDFFINETQYGRELDSLPHRLRQGWLMGDWNEFGGQFYDVWSYKRFVKRCLPDRDWHPRWLGIDWGFRHPCVCYWNARVGKITKIYREHHQNELSARAQAQQIVDKTPVDERKLIDAIYLSPDAFQKKSEQDSFAELMGSVFQANGMPYPIPADDSRIHGAQCMYDLMKSDELEIDPSCKHLIDVIPMICTEEDDPQEIIKFDGDDAWDAARYALKSRQRAGLIPVTEVADERLKKFAESRNTTVEEMDINTVASLHRRAMAQEKKKRKHGRRLSRFRPGRAA